MDEFRSVLGSPPPYHQRLAQPALPPEPPPFHTLAKVETTPIAAQEPA